MGLQQGGLTTFYGSADLVVNYFEQYDAFTDTTDPTLSDVERMLRKWSAYIDTKTGHAWRERQIVDEYHDIDGPYYWHSGTPITLKHRHIVTPLDSASGDKVEIWDGSQWRDWVADASRTEGRDGDYWVDHTNGILYVYRRPLFRTRPEFRVSYRFGGTHGVPEDIDIAAAKFTAADLIKSDVYGVTVPGGESSMNQRDSAESYVEQAEEIVTRYKEVRRV